MSTEPKLIAPLLKILSQKGVKMTTTLVIDDNLIEEARVIGKHKSSTEVVIEALREYIQYRKQLQILALFGTIDYDETYDYKEQRQRQ